MGVHDGHRARKLGQFLDHGLDAFSDHEALELLLYFALPRRDTNELAHALLGSFGSLAAVLTASAAELEQVTGVGPRTAALLTLVAPMVRRARVGASGKPIILNTTEELGGYFSDLFFGVHDERLYMACLDGKGKLLRCVTLAEGSVDAMSINLRRVVEVAFQSNASAAVLSHNHPSGVALPSADDNSMTLAVWDVLRRIGVRLLDHIIVADDDYVSLRENGLLPR